MVPRELLHFEGLGLAGGGRDEDGSRVTCVGHVEFVSVEVYCSASCSTIDMSMSEYLK